MRAARDLPSSLPPRPLYDFLATELLDAAPDGVPDGLTLLAAASIGDVVTAGLVLGAETSSILEDARRRGLLQLEDDGALSLHPLLRDLLLARLPDQDDDERGRLVERLRPLVERRRWDEALAASEALPIRAFVSSALRSALPELVRGGRVATLRRWSAVGRVAEVGEGLADYADAEVALRDADFDRAIALGESAARSLSGDLASRAHLVAAQGSNLTDRATRAEMHLSEAERLSQSPETRQAALWGRLNQAIDHQRSHASETLATFELASDRSVEHRVRVAHGRISLALLRGKVEEALGDAEVAVADLSRDVDPMVRTSFLNAYAYALAVAARYEESLAVAREEEEHARKYELSFVARHALVNKARAYIGIRRFALADRALAMVETQLKADGDPHLDAHCRMYRARLYVSTADLRRAGETLAYGVSSRLSPGARADYIALRALIRASSGEATEAVRLASEARRTSSFRETVAMAAMAEAIARLDNSGALSTALYERALESEALDPIVLGLRASPQLTARIAESAHHRDRLTALLVSSCDAALARRVGIATPRSARRTSPLSRRELEVHELISQGRTNREIAMALYISPSTAKLHVCHILEKLGVRSRVEAARVWQAPEDADPAR
jgi:ATP/maltotriose-dependent transcriptional regulator MalT